MNERNTINPGTDINIDDAMDVWLRDCACVVRVTDVQPAVIAGLLRPAGIDDHYTHYCTKAGREYMIINAMMNTNCSRDEAIRGLDYIDGI